ncbi:MAG: polymorphic toxin-type HINT domain-containing protein [Planctomycetota bacterium]
MIADTNATFTRVSYETAVSLSRGVTDSQASLADLTMQVSDQAVRSGETLLQATSGLTGAITQIGSARQENERLFALNNTGVSNSLDEGKDFRDDNFNHAALAAIESIEKIEREEILNRLQFVLALLGAVPGPIGIGFNLLNAEISKARGNAEAARDYTIYAIPFVGGVYGLGQLGVMLGQYTASKLSQAISAQPGDETPTELPVVHRVNWVSGPGGGNSFVAGTGVVTGVDEDGNLITTAIEDLEVGDVVLAGNELDPTDPTSYELVTATSHRTVHELTEVTYVDEDGNIEVIKATDNHEFYAEGIGWVKAAALTQGALLRLADGRTATVTSTTTLDVSEGVEVYNLTVTDGKTYFVDDGEGNVAAAWVHNQISKLARRVNLIKNRWAGAARETRVYNKLTSVFKKASVQREQYLRTASGAIARDSKGRARRLDFVVIEQGKIKAAVEVTSKTAAKSRHKVLQRQKERVIRQSGGTFIKDRLTGQLIDLSKIKTKTLAIK